MSVTHPARYSAALLAELGPMVAEASHVHDPFAGTGERLGALCDALNVRFSGTELEAPFIADPRVCQGDSRDPFTYPVAHDRYPWWIVTSPVYANGMADNFKPADTSKRHTYRAALIQTTGDPDAELAEGNMGAQSYRGGMRARGRYWAIAQACMVHWHLAERVVVNVSDFYMAGALVAHVEEWETNLALAGFTVERVTHVPTPRMRHGANGSLRADTEAIIVARPRRTT